MNLKRPLYGPQDPRGPSHGRDVRDFVKRTLYRMPAQTGLGENFFPKPPGGFDDVYNAKTVEAVEVVRRWHEQRPFFGPFRQSDVDTFWMYADAYSKWVYRLYRPPATKPAVPDLGPVVAGDRSILTYALTHPTDGIPGYPAIDAGWLVGRDVLAVEDLVVTKASSANVGDAFYATGSSKMAYWYGHIIVAPAVGRRFRRGEKVGDIAPHPNGAHVHFGMDARPLIGHSLAYGYGPGIPTVGEQLERALG